MRIQKIGKARGKIVAIREDGLKVFFDGKSDPELDRIRRTEPDKIKVILAVAMRRAQQIAVNYAATHAPDCAEAVSRLVYGQEARKLQEA